MKPGRNDSCSCGSGRKYKHCCQLAAAVSAGCLPVTQLMQAALAHHTAGQLAQAEPIYRQLLQAEPNHPEANYHLGLIALQMGQPAAGLPYLECARKNAPGNEQFCLTVTNCLLSLDRADDALRTIAGSVPRVFNSARSLQMLQQAKEIASGQRPPLSIEGEVFGMFNAGHHALLESRMPRLLDQYPNWGQGWQLLGIALASQNKDGEKALRRASELSPGDAEAHNNLGTFLSGQGATAAASECYRRALELDPNHADAQYNLGNILFGQGAFDAARVCYVRALEIRPNHAETHNNLGSVLKAQGHADAAEASFNRALQIRPGYAEACNNLGGILMDRGELNAAETRFRRALEIMPGYADAHNNLGCVLKNQGRLDVALASFRRAVDSRAGCARDFSNMLLTKQYAEGYSEAESLVEHLAYAQRFEAPLRSSWRAHTNLDKADRRLRIGYVSADLRAHAVAYFIEPLLAHHDHEQVDVYCYYNHATADEVTQRLKGLAGHWRDIAGQPDEDVAELIRRDGIDILVDLAGHSAGNRLLVFARKPAPVQATWLGYLCTTGLASMDYRITDGSADPVGRGEQYYSETLVRLPDTFVCYRPSEDSPAVSALPMATNGCVTFGSFNNLAKITPAVLALWAKILLAVPRSRLMLKTISLADTATRQRVVADFAAHGIAGDRLVLAVHDAERFEHMNRYNQLDIGLDPFPCNGGTTSFDAMWMGVPVVSLAGDRFISRMGVSMLVSLGLAELVAQTEAEYVDLAVRLARDRERLAELRKGLRERMRTSPLTDAEGFARNLEKAYREMWIHWCGQAREEAP